MENPSYIDCLSKLTKEHKIYCAPVQAKRKLVKMIYRIIREKNYIDRKVLWIMKWKQGYVYHVYHLPCLSCSFTFNFLASVHKSLGLSRKTHSWRGNCGNSIPSSSIIKVNNIQFSTTKPKQTDSLLSSIGFSIWRKEVTLALSEQYPIVILTFSDKLNLSIWLRTLWSNRNLQFLISNW